MSLSGLQSYLARHCRVFTGTMGSSTIRGAVRGDDVHSKAVTYLRNAFRGRDVNFDRLAIAACNDLVSQRVLSLHDQGVYRTFKNSRNCYLFLNSRRSIGGTGRRSRLPA